MKLDILAIGAHPDDMELSASGTIIKAVSEGKKVGILDLTKGELGTRGTPEIRAKEAEAATKIMGLSCRDNAELPDGFIENVKDHQMAIIPFIRKYSPEIVITNAIRDRHPDHGMAAELVSKACFLSGLRAIPTEWEGEPQSAWRPKNVYHIIQDRYIQPDLVVDISGQWQGKLDSIRAFSSQFFVDGGTDEPATPISTPEFMKFLEARAREMGRLINVEYGEGFTCERPVGVQSLDLLI